MRTTHIGAGMIIANRDYLRGLDELQQKIQLEAMALTNVAGILLGRRKYL